MTTMLLLLLSGVLIGTGVSLIWRDIHHKRRDAFVLSRDSKSEAEIEPEVEIVVSRPAAAAPLSSQPAQAPAAIAVQRSSLSSQLLKIAKGAVSSDDPPVSAEPFLRPHAAPPSAIAQQWAALQPVIAAAVEQVNSVLDGAGVAIGTPGEPFSGENKAYGSDRPLLVRGESPGHLRLECTPGGRLFAIVKSKDESLAEINSDASAAAPGLSIARASDLLSECLKPVAAYAMRTKDQADQLASEVAWNSTESTVIAALKAGNGALSQAGARLLPLATPAWDETLRHYRMPVSVQVFGNDIARMHIDRLDEEIEVAVGLPQPHLAGLGRRERIPLEGMTMHALAEMIASCAWPAIERYRETRPS
jgi:hypothetical protein